MQYKYEYKFEYEYECEYGCACLDGLLGGLAAQLLELLALRLLSDGLHHLIHVDELAAEAEREPPRERRAPALLRPGHDDLARGPRHRTHQVRPRVRHEALQRLLRREYVHLVEERHRVRRFACNNRIRVLVATNARVHRTIVESYKVFS